MTAICDNNRVEKYQKNRESVETAFVTSNYTVEAAQSDIAFHKCNKMVEHNLEFADKRRLVLSIMALSAVNGSS